MKLRTIGFAALLGLAGAVGTARAQDRPPLAPTRDAVIDYRIGGKGGKPGLSVRVHFSGDKIRAEPATLPGYLIVDRRGEQAVVVLEQAHAYFEIPLSEGPARDYLPSDRMGFVKAGESRVAGLACTVWDVTAPGGRTATACVTQDGLVLRGEGHDPQYGGGSLEAVSVAYAPQPPGLFQPPAGFQRLAMPPLPGLADGRPPR